ncbi:MAG: hypothetical protein JW719_05940 [Pirellulales bacterium]|nr:hypothetical protein [Pirellulales bacterium]
MMLTTRMYTVVLLVAILGFSSVWAYAASETKKKTEAHPEPALSWHDQYRDAIAEARRDGKMLFILFCAAGDASRCDALVDGALVEPEVRDRLKSFTRLRAPLDATILQNKERVTLIDQPAFAEMQGRQGIAIIDFAHRGAEYYETVVSCFPMLGGQPYTAQQVRVILDLPPGTLTQRTLIYAVRIHPERPASTDGRLEPSLAEEAESHSIHQASIRLQGHHNWNSRFFRINRRLSNGLVATEVCAESWPGEGLLRAAIECVRCWRLSSGHWRAVRGRHRCYGYDMRRGSNGIWYATGIFGSRQ